MFLARTLHRTARTLRTARHPLKHSRARHTMDQKRTRLDAPEPFFKVKKLTEHASGKFPPPLMNQAGMPRRHSVPCVADERERTQRRHPRRGVRLVDAHTTHF